MYDISGMRIHKHELPEKLDSFATFYLFIVNIDNIRLLSKREVIVQNQLFIIE